MKKIIIILSVLTLALSACLKDKPNVDFSNLGTVVELVGSGTANFGADAITSTADTINTTFQINVDSPNPPTSDITIGLAIDNSLITVDPAVGYIAMPTSAYKLSATSFTIKAGQRLAYATLTIYKKLLDPSKSYQLPVKIASTSQGIISGNFGVHYYHIIGNDFAGSYTHYYTRYNASDSVTVASNPTNSVVNASQTISPVNPVQFEVASYYYLGPKYEVTYTKTGNGTNALYSNFAVSLNSDDVTASTAANSAVVYGTPSMPLLPASGSFTKSQVLQRLKFILPAASSGSPRYTIDRYVHN